MSNERHTPRSERLGLRLTSAEKAALSRLARGEDRTPSGFLRFLLFRELRKRTTDGRLVR